MMRTFIARALRLPAVTLLAGVALAGCGLEEQNAPDLIGPSEFGLSLTLTATPDQLTRDGVSTTAVTLFARDAQGQPVAGQRITATAAPAGTTLSTADLTTDASGRTDFTVTAPPSSSTGDRITISVTPIGGNFDNAVSRTFTIAVTPSNPSAPAASFTMSNATPALGESVRFDASASTDEGAACATACTFAWTFADGSTATGVSTSRSFSSTGVQAITLRVTDPGGASSSTTETITVAAPTAPSAGTITFGPTPVRPGATANFDAGGATVGAGATIDRYTWVWGDGSSNTESSSAQAQHSFADAGVYTVRVTVRDSLGRTATSTTTVTVTAS